MKKITVNITDELYEQLTGMAADRGVTLSALIRRSVSIEKWFWDHRDEPVFVGSGSDRREVVVVDG